MNRFCMLALSLALVNSAYATDDAAQGAATPSAEAASVAASTIPNGDFCLYAGAPPSDVKYRSLGRVKLGKGTYGGVRDELPAFVAEARAKGADAITNYNGAQRFGFWPWRLVRPVLTGVAVKFDEGKSPACVVSGGATLATVMSTNLEPPRR
jgi:hypothetical protein